ncbi:hypothetical protein SCOR_03000 [Sulfidibacter corallicola]|uniref:Uncharacterized protein n=1 Tax=Sulfidibacter corallicola TaxID=2818388 RepID=A0A8A4TFU1_SULCO|nr:hypothetical protein [Sulfidibacter corallicola]QTD48503.1 hypothetical protein J3U87_23230 [Sulfidibacter corallicola]
MSGNGRACLKWLGVATAIALFQPGSLACEVCFGNPEDPQTKGMASAILFMLVVTYLLLAGILAFFIYQLKSRKNRIQNTKTSHS